MPKRTNPFGDHSSLQLKNSLQGKVINGVSQQTSVQSVYAVSSLLYLKQTQLMKNSALKKCCPPCRACHNCRKALQSRDVMKCQLCQNYNCCHCVRLCGGCHLHFCHLCFIVNYNQQAERAVCMNCQGR